MSLALSLSPEMNIRIGDDILIKVFRDKKCRKKIKIFCSDKLVIYRPKDAEALNIIERIIKEDK